MNMDNALLLFYWLNFHKKICMQNNFFNKSEFICNHTPVEPIFYHSLIPRSANLNQLIDTLVNH